MRFTCRICHLIVVRPGTTALVCDACWNSVSTFKSTHTAVAMCGFCGTQPCMESGPYCLGCFNDDLKVVLMKSGPEPFIPLEAPTSPPRPDRTTNAQWGTRKAVTVEDTLEQIKFLGETIKVVKESYQKHFGDDEGLIIEDEP